MPDLALPGMTTDQTYFAFIRAINTGNRRLRNDQIIAPFVGLGFTGVAAYQAAGNVVFCTDDPQEASSERIEAALADAYGFDAPVFVRHIDQARAAVDANPFGEADIAETAGRIQISFMRTAADPATVASIQAMVPDDDRVVFSGREWYWLPTRGISESQLNVRSIETLAGAMTMRTLGTVTRMVARYSS